MNKRKIRRRNENSALSLPGQDFEEKFGSGNKEYIDQESSLPCGTANTSRNTAREDGDTRSSMADRAERLKTFQNWPHDNPKPDKLAKAGFYCVKEIYPVKDNGDPSGAVTDLCCCFACGVRLDNWKPDDDPFIEHARHNHQCPYIIQCKGRDFISAIQHLTMKGIIKPTKIAVKEWMTTKKSKIEIRAPTTDTPVPATAASAPKTAASAPKTAAPTPSPARITALTTVPIAPAPATTTTAPAPTTAAPSTSAETRCYLTGIMATVHQAVEEAMGRDNLCGCHANDSGHTMGNANVIINYYNNSDNRDYSITNNDNSITNNDNSITNNDNSITNNDNSITNNDNSITNNDNSTTNIDTSSRITTNNNNSINKCEVKRAQNLPINCTVNNNLQPLPNDDSDEKDDDDDEKDDDGTVRNASFDDDAH